MARSYVAHGRMARSPRIAKDVVVALLTDAVRLYERAGFVRCPEFDLRATDVFASESADEMVGLAFRLDLEGSPERRR